MSAVQAPAPPPGERRCRSRPRPLEDGSLRPTDVIGVFFLAGLAMIVAGAVVAVLNAADPWSWGRWLALHLVFVGGISQLILGASQFFAGAFLATDPPARPLVRLQLVGWNAGAITIALAVPLGGSLATCLGVGLLVAVLGAYAAGFVQMRQRSLGSAPWASRWYLAAASFLAIGVVAGAMLATGSAWSHGNLLGAHMALNLGGWFGAAIVGTLHTFFPSLTRSRLRFPRLQMPTFVAWVGGIAALAGGYGFSFDGLAVLGWALLFGAASMLAANVTGSLLAAPRPLSLPARIVAAAQVFLLAGPVRRHRGRDRRRPGRGARWHDPCGCRHPARRWLDRLDGRRFASAPARRPDPGSRSAPRDAGCTAPPRRGADDFRGDRGGRDGGRATRRRRRPGAVDESVADRRLRRAGGPRRDSQWQGAGRGEAAAMKRSPELTPLSHDHHQALFVAQRLRRAEQVEQPAAEFRQFWDEHGSPHFRIEEEVLLPMWAALGNAQPEHVDRIAREHLAIRAAAYELAAGRADLEQLQRLGGLLAAHVRYEERELFPLIEDDLDAGALGRVGAAVAAAEAG